MIGYTDFFWPEHGVVVEFDGVAKYVREEYTRGRNTADLVLAEKRREDRLRALGYVVIRVDWRDLREPTRVRTKLLKAGLPLRGIREPEWLR
ncbi:hypothetical protein [Desertivibrio insolitus]|uniref:hypothetical protein n=1 Tax=Herbiconiux sp. SYSU D00978 TaxID=2812562 RepID=UPI001A9644AC|nr:hypothetical protein [Herbiconiux sp. SYSU D00978]